MSHLTRYKDYRTKSGASIPRELDENVLLYAISRNTSRNSTPTISTLFLTTEDTEYNLTITKPTKISFRCRALPDDAVGDLRYAYASGQVVSAPSTTTNGGCYILSEGYEEYEEKIEVDSLTLYLAASIPNIPVIIKYWQSADDDDS